MTATAPLTAGGELQANRNLLEWAVTFMVEAHGWSKEAVAHALGYSAQSGIYDILKREGNRPLPEGRGPRLLELIAMAQEPGNLPPPAGTVPLTHSLRDTLLGQGVSGGGVAGVGPGGSLLDLLVGVQRDLEQIAQRVEQRAHEGVRPWMKKGLLEGAQRVRELKGFFEPA